MKMSEILIQSTATMNKAREYKFAAAHANFFGFFLLKSFKMKYQDMKKLGKDFLSLANHQHH